jgi:hypothetical protein
MQLFPTLGKFSLANVILTLGRQTKSIVFNMEPHSAVATLVHYG